MVLTLDVKIDSLLKCDIKDDEVTVKPSTLEVKKTNSPPTSPYANVYTF